MSLPRHLVIMARAPRLGRVKRRLARDIGALNAQIFYRRNLATVLQRLGQTPKWTTWLAITPDREIAGGTGHFRDADNIIAQGQGDLGDRMARLFTILPRGPVVIVGSDIPGITNGHIAAAFDQLGRHDWVFGPAPDGGYWLVGARRRPVFANPFGDVRWSSEHALADTLADIRGPVAYVATLNDIDSAADLP